MEPANFIFPTVVLIAGIVLFIRPAKEINSVYGFRTKTASKNQQTWEYCNKLCAKILVAEGFISVIAICATCKITEKIFGIFSVGEIVNILAICIILLSIPVVNYRCRRKFPKLFYNNKN